MANVLVISGSYYPYATANAACMKEFEKSLINNGHTVTYAIKQHDKESSLKTVQNEIEIYHIPKKVDKFYKKLNTLKNKNIFNKLYYYFVKIFFKVYAICFYGSTRNFAEKEYLKLYAKKIKEIVNDKKIDLIISISVPFDSHEAVLLYLKKNKNSKIKWMPYIIDSYSQKINAKDIQKKLKEEYKVFDRADKLLFLSVLKNDYTKEEFKKYLDKMYFLPIPTFKLEESKEEKTKNEGKITCVYAGILYDDIRPLSFFYKFFVKANLQNKIKFHFMGKRYEQNEKRLIELKNSGYEVIIEGIMPSDYAKTAVKNADIVLNIGNLYTNQITSKIFQYMSEKKPILTFYRIKEDTSMPYLKKYPLAMNIFEDKNSFMKESIKKVEEFIDNSRNMQVSINELKEIFKEDTRDKVCEDFIKIIEEII